MNPLLPIEYLVLAGLALAALGAWLSWRTALSCGPARRGVMAALRGGALAALVLPALNPGEWVAPEEERRSELAVLVDQSGSMATADVDGQARLAAAKQRAREIAGLSDDVRWFGFDRALREVESPEEIESGGAPTDLLGSISALLERYPPGGTRLEGIVLLSDGRQIAPGTKEPLLARAVALGVPIHPLVLGGDVKMKDLRIETPQRHYTAFKGQKLRVRVRVAGEEVGNVEPVVRLLDAEGNLVGEQPARLAGEGRVDVMFEVGTAEPGYAEYRLETEQLPGEKNLANNSARIAVTVLDGKVRTLLVEGSPYWDSKFIAQLLQRQENYQLSLVSRLTGERFFSLGQAGAAEEGLLETVQAVFPADAAAMREYDLIVLGRSVEYFLDEEKAALLREWVEEHGGGLICARGNPFSTEVPGLAPLFPMTWEQEWRGEYRWEPTYAGEDVGLFGEALPGLRDPVWAKLPPLREASTGVRSQSFAQVLAEGVAEVDGRTKRFPVVVSRRAGEGLVVAVNSDDMWQWDFFPHFAGASEVYREFWLQLFNWAVTYSEFLPGRNFAMKLGQSRVETGEPVRVRVQRRAGTMPDFQPALRLLRDGEVVREVEPGASPRDENRWETVLTIKEPGYYQVELGGAVSEGESAPVETLEVAAPPGEDELLSADRELMAELATATGGVMLSETGLGKIFERDEQDAEPGEGRAEWQSTWDRWWLLLPMVGFFAAEWIVRRRSGLL